MNKCIFLDRDGVINKERGEYTYKLKDFLVEDEVIEQLQKLKSKGYKLIIITNQGGIDKGIYTKDDVYSCHEYFQEKSNYIIDDLFYSPYHDDYTKSLSRKPGSLMLERAIYKWDTDISNSWMIGDSKRDLQAGNTVGIKSLYIGSEIQNEAEQSFESSALALKFISSL